MVAATKKYCIATAVIEVAAIRKESGVAATTENIEDQSLVVEAFKRRCSAATRYH